MTIKASPRTSPSATLATASPPAIPGDSQALEGYLRDRYVRGTSQRSGREHVKNWLTSAIVPAEAFKARRLAQREAPLKLHLGCADTYLDGWVNIDMVRPGRRLDLRWDLRRGLPFPAKTVEGIFSEHLFEHIPLPGALALLRECRRVMVTGGVIRTGVPDLDCYVRGYLGEDPIIDDLRSGRPTRAIALSELFYFHGHRTMYDFETLALLLREAGFRRIEHSAFGESALQPQPDSEHRRRGTLYVEAVAE